MMYKYNYVVFNSVGSQYKIPSEDDYYVICIEDLKQSEHIQIVKAPMEHHSFLLRFLHAVHNSKKIAKYINLPFKDKWYPLFFKSRFTDNKPLCFVDFCHGLDIEYFEYLKKRYPGCKIVLLHRDFLRICTASHPRLPFNPILDLEMTYDEEESKKYGFPHFSEFESKVDIPINQPFESDVFFAGKAKDRLPKLLDAYKKLADAGLKVYFYLTGVPAEQQESLPGIVYASRNMSYREMLYHTVNSKCMLEIVQGGGQAGYTSRFLEAVIYGKKLITDHAYVKNSKFYDPAKIQLIESIDDLDPDFVKSGDGFVDYNYNGEFSPFRMIERIEEELDKQSKA